ncbi:aminoglycoside phosphotransferase family protein [Streptomyces sp. MMS20-AI2-20]|uniref:aminoglycoside phosphotransferase family protein n=1 Tax=Streptomyces sp. MMS20-AI2-20 TaxID=2925835 RepID=UPI0016755330|nr:aminoglycoside phosphotransferase family protein [Streptomyces sp. MMS20-AI2-20]MCI4145675.1 aminoglycoside phosphotransferase family protein [Streptomyces sp. MMS20-AI2-20]GGQ30262.1 hydroxyurea phosphotransferase [Streptomyces gancidicus]
MSTLEAVEVPQCLAVSYARGFGEEGRAWIAGLPTLAAEFLDRWELKRDGAVGAGEASLVLPVLRRNGTRAVLKLQMPREETTAALIGLRTWNGDGMVRLLDHDPETSTMLLERLNAARTLTSVEDDDAAMGILAELQARLVRVPAPQGLRSLGDITAEMLEKVPTAVEALADRADRQLLRGWASAVAELADEPGDRMLHWDLHYDNVLAAQREPWLAIDPEPLAGDPGFDLWPALDSRWDDVVMKNGALRVVRRRFDLLTEVLGLDRARATGWTLGRLLQNSLWDIEDGETTLASSSIAITKSLLNR